ncbi:MAG: extracellular solute-binding protein [Lachnospiraceae bacterium]|nr:extracellular solute-binding protein [Lachnospiraceae bacterium]
MRIKTYTFIFLTLFLLGGLYYALQPLRTAEESRQVPPEAQKEMETIIMWYTDAALTDYIDSAARLFYEAEGVRVEPVLKSGLEYVEEIHEAAISGGSMPDLYLIGSDSLEKAAMAGVAAAPADPEHILNDFNFPSNALDAVTYRGQVLAYPFYFDTAFLLYNQSYLSQMAESSLRSELAGQSPEEEGDVDQAMENRVEESGVPEGLDEERWQEMIAQRTQEMIPSSIEDILKLASEQAAPEGMENVFLWDVSDIYYNYFFTGAYMDVGGSYGDDPKILKICNEDTVQCMTVYQGLHEFFSIDSRESSYESVLQEFLDGKTLFTIATTDALATLNRMCESGEFHYGYGVAALPGVDNAHEAKGLSATSCIAVNAYTEHAQAADLFAEYLMYELTDTLYERAGKLPCIGSAAEGIRSAEDVVRMIYRDSVPLPKLIRLSNFWVELEQAYIRVWDGADPQAELEELDAQMRAQLK